MKFQIPPLSLFYHFSQCLITIDSRLCSGRLERRAGRRGDHAHLVSGGRQDEPGKPLGTVPLPFSGRGQGPSVIRTRLVGQPEGHPGEGTALCVSSSSTKWTQTCHLCPCRWVCFKCTEQGSGSLRPRASGRLGHLEFPCLRMGGGSSCGQWRGQMSRRQSMEFLASSPPVTCLPPGPTPWTLRDMAWHFPKRSADS